MTDDLRSRLAALREETEASDEAPQRITGTLEQVAQLRREHHAVEVLLVWRDPGGRVQVAIDARGRESGYALVWDALTACDRLPATGAISEVSEVHEDG